MHSTIDQRSSKIIKLVASLAGLSFAASIVLHLYTITFSRMLADDFCSAWRAQVQGPLRAAYAWYRIWSGRYSANLLDGLVGWMGASFYQLSIIVLVLLWIAALYYFFHQLLSRVLESHARFAAVLLALAVTATTMNSIPLVQQSIYWGQGMRALLPPLILLPLFLGILLKLRLDALSPTRLWLFVGFTFLFAIFTGGFSETGLAMQTGWAGIGLLLALLAKKRGLALTAGAFLLGSAAALLVMWLSPGTAVRQGSFQPSTEIFTLLSVSFSAFTDWLLPNLTQHWLMGLCVFTMGLFLGLSLPFSRARIAGFQRGLIITAISAVVVAFLVFIPSAYVMSWTMPPRTMILPQFVWILFIVCFAFFVGIRLRGINLPPLACLIPLLLGIALVVAANILYMGRTQSILRDYRPYAAAWDQRDQFLRSQRAAGVTSVTIPRLTNPAYLDNLVNNPEYWVNACYSDYYSLEVLVPEE